jgi:serine/threonine protein kinase
MAYATLRLVLDADVAVREWVPARGDIVADRYLLTARIARGGMGSVWRAQDGEREVAIKLLTETKIDELTVARFKREARALSRLATRHVTAIYEHGLHDGVPFIAMELLEGYSLRKALADGPLPRSLAAQIVREVCVALSLAHDAGIVHRDLTPANIFLARDEEGLVTKILDFGIAKEQGVPVPTAERTTTGTFVGTPRYMSPEQLEGGSLDGRTDLWSLAAVVHRILTGRDAFPQTDVVELFDAIRHTPVAAPGLDAPLDAFFARAFERDPRLRFQSAGAMALAFEDALAGRMPPAEATVTTEVTRSEARPISRTLRVDHVPAPRRSRLVFVAPIALVASAAVAVFLLPRDEALFASARADAAWTAASATPVPSPAPEPSASSASAASASAPSASAGPSIARKAAVRPPSPAVQPSTQPASPAPSTARPSHPLFGLPEKKNP